MRWLNRERLTIYPRLIVGIYLVALAGFLVVSAGGVDPKGRPIGNDFMAFWSAATLADRGEAAAAYQPARLFDVQKSALPAAISRYAWLYPPTFLLVVQPLAKLPYFLALVGWTLITLLPLVLLVRRLVPESLGLWLFAAFPGCFQNLMQGQNGFMTAALFGGGLHFIDRRPWLSGILFGLLSYKPQFGLLIPLVLIATKRWLVLAAASLTVAGFALATIPVFGIEIWRVFIDSIGLSFDLLADGGVPWRKMASLYASLRLLGVPLWLAVAIHGLGAIVVAAATVQVWRGPADPALKAAILVLGALFLSPYSFDYDLVLLALPICWLGWFGHSEGLLPWEKAALLLNWMMPVLATVISVATDMEIAWIAPAWLFWLLWQRHRRAGASSARDLLAAEMR